MGTNQLTQHGFATLPPHSLQVVHTRALLIQEGLGVTPAHAGDIK